MKRQEIADKFNKQISIENYSEQTKKDYLSTLKQFLEGVENSKLHKVVEMKYMIIYFIAKQKKSILIQL